MLINSIKQQIKNAYVRLSYYHGKPQGKPENTLVFFMKSGYHQPHPGLVDRFKIIVGLYYTAKCNDMDFIFCHDKSFPLENYLVPNKVKWNRDEDISYSCKDTQTFVHEPRAAVPKFKKGFQQHCYYYEGKNILRENKVANWQQMWSDLYHELFSASDRLKAILDKQLPQGEYVAVHLRFVNTLDKFEDRYESNLSEESKQQLIDDCIETLGRIREREEAGILVFSDSKRFLKEAASKGYESLNFEDVGHVAESNSEAVWDKTFLDLYAIAGAKKVYSVRGGAMYNSAFPEYAALIGYKECNIEKIGK